MRFQIAYSYLDYTRRSAYTTVNIQGVETFAALDTLIASVEPVISALSSAVNVGAEAKTAFKLGNEHAALVGSSVFRRALLVCRYEDTYGTFTIPAPSPFPTVSSGPLAGILADRAPSPFVSSVQALHGLLAGTVLPDGTAFPAGEWRYALMEP